MRPVLLSVILLFLLFRGAAGQDRTVTYLRDPASVPPSLAVSLTHLKADIRFHPEENLVFATAEFTFIPNRYRTDSIEFYTPDFTIRSLSLSGKPAEWKQRDKTLVIYPSSSLLEYGKEAKVQIEYEARPQAGLIYFIGWRPEEAGKRKQIWAHRPHGWLPYMDARITADLFIRFDSAYAVFSNGEKLEVRPNPDGTKTWHYRMAKNHPFFSTALVIGDYDVKKSKSAGGVPMEFWYYRGQEEKVRPTYQYSEAMMDFFEKELGVKYPYPVYRQAPVIDYMYGAMETTTSTVFGDFMLIDPRAFWQRNYINTNAHELAHQWFGNYISHLVNKDVWLTESFGTYYAKMFERSVFGEDHYQNMKNEETLLVLNAARSNDYPVGSSMGGVARIYQKGSLVLGMLRYVMGDREFRNAVTRYLEQCSFRNAETSEFIRAVYETGHQPYSWFFDEWVFRGGEPAYQVSYTIRDDTTGNRMTVFSVYQVHETTDLIGLFRMPVVFRVCYTDGSADQVKAWIENKFHEVVVPNPEKKKIDFVLFDPGREILKKVYFDRTFEELSAQAMRAPDMIDRYDAVVALRKFPADQKRALLTDCFSRERFHLVRTEIIEQLAGDDPENNIELMRQALNDRDANVRKAVLANLFPASYALLGDFEKALDDTSYLNIELALDNLSRSFPQLVPHFLEVTGGMEGWRGKNIRMKWLEISILSGRLNHYEELKEYSGPKFEFETRMNALSLAKRLNFCPDGIIENAVLAYLHWNPKLSAVGKDVLNYFLDQDTCNKAISDYVKRNTWTDQEKKQLGQLHWKIE